MKTLLLLCTLAALSAGCVRKSELTKTQAELATLQEQIRLLEQQRVPRAEFEQARAVVAATQEKLAALTQELAVTREQLTGSRELLVIAAEREKAAERRLSQPETAGTQTVLSPGLVKGTYTQLEDTIVYSRDAQLNFGNGVTIYSPTGLMLSDKDRGIVAGDLVVESPRAPGPTAVPTNPVSEVKPETQAGRSPPGTK